MIAHTFDNRVTAEVARQLCDSAQHFYEAKAIVEEGWQNDDPASPLRDRFYESVAVENAWVFLTTPLWNLLTAALEDVVWFDIAAFLGSENAPPDVDDTWPYATDKEFQNYIQSLPPFSPLGNTLLMREYVPISETPR